MAMSSVDGAHRAETASWWCYPLGGFGQVDGVEGVAHVAGELRLAGHGVDRQVVGTGYGRPLDGSVSPVLGRSEVSAVLVQPRTSLLDVGIHTVIDLGVVRSHEYYTGVSFEVDVQLPDGRLYAEIAGGGRDGGHPDLSPGSVDLPAVIRLLDQLPKTVSPSPIPDAPSVASVLEGGFHGWRALADQQAELDPWSTRHIEQLAAIERDWLAESAGVCLLHVDLRADNVLMRGDDALVIDWAYLHQGADWIDPAFLVPQLIRAGHTPAQAEDLIVDVASWAAAPPHAITSFAVAQAGYWERNSRLPAPPGVPYLRGYQASMAAIGRTWIEFRTGWH
ncbi:phosphotransferase family protein [Streptomyces novaecaesareae]|uniref:phosphotransferase family protein n=2 Tax=Streptomyces TaxID=1883 RepID=UPI0012FE8689|nr:phosphotransferase [Streptomyces novaecaesareae]